MLKECVIAMMQWSETHFEVALRLGAQSVTLLSTLRDPTQLRRHQCATRQQHPTAIRQKKFG